MTISFGFNIVTCDTGVIRRDNCHIILMHSFITILKELISTMMKDKTLLTSFSEQRIGNSGQRVDWPGPVLSLQTINTIERGDPATTQSHRTTTQQHNITQPQQLNFICKMNT